MALAWGKGLGILAGCMHTIPSCFSYGSAHEISGKISPISGNDTMYED